MKTYVLLISQTFPVNHLKAGNPTNFVSLIRSCSKIHTLRANYALWEKRFEEIEKGKACISLRFWSGNPYRSKQVEIIRLTKEDGIGLEKLWYEKIDTRVYSVPHSTVKRVDKNIIAENDGLSDKDFQEWFKNYDTTQPLALIHFTGFRYCNKNGHDG